MADIKETAWDFIQGEKTGTFYSGQQKWIKKIHKYKEKYPDQIDIIHINSDGSVLAHAPESWFKFSPPKQMNISKERRKEMAENMRRIANNKKQQNT